MTNTLLVMFRNPGLYGRRSDYEMLPLLSCSKDLKTETEVQIYRKLNSPSGSVSPIRSHQRYSCQQEELTLKLTEQNPSSCSLRLMNLS